MSDTPIECLILYLLRQWAKLTSVSKTEGPQSEVGCSVGDAAKAVLDGVDGLTHKHLTKLKLKHHQQILGTILSVLYMGYFFVFKSLYGSIAFTRAVVRIYKQA